MKYINSTTWMTEKGTEAGSTIENWQLQMIFCSEKKGTLPDIDKVRQDLSEEGWSDEAIEELIEFANRHKRLVTS